MGGGERRPATPSAIDAYFTGAIKCWYGVPAHIT